MRKSDQAGIVAWRLTLEYDGSRYRGWQAQKNAPGVQAALLRAAEEVLGVPVEIQGAGRTDAGVHALGQVAHLKAAPGRRWPAAELKLRLNQALPADLVVLSAEPVPPRFHARHHAESRLYLYRISIRKTAFHKRYSWWVKEELDLDSMQQAAALLVGRHDFAAFRAPDPSRPDESTVVVVEKCGWTRVGEELHFRIEASHFLWKMVRRVVGTLVKVGSGALSVKAFAGLLEGRIPPGVEVAAWTAPAAGLFLESVRYGQEGKR